MTRLQITVSPDFDNAEVLTLLRHQALSTGMIRRLKHADGILLDGQPVTVRHRVKAGQSLILDLPDAPSRIEPIPMELEIVYEDEWLLVVNKPAGIPVHPSQGHHDDTLANGVAYYYRDTPFTFRPITRLDRYTAGLVLIAKNPVAAASLCGQIREGTIEKTYYAVTDGVPNPIKGSVTLPISRVEDSVIKRQVREDGKPALTYYETVAVKGGKALVKVQPVTGRTHQIRVHMAAIGCPLAYDFLYGREEAGKNFFLCCTGLIFMHPEKKVKIKIEIEHNCADF